MLILISKKEKLSFKQVFCSISCILATEFMGLSPVRPQGAPGDWFICLMWEDEEGKMRRVCVLRTHLLKHYVLENHLSVRTILGSLAKHQTLFWSGSSSLGLPEYIPLPFEALWVALVKYPFIVTFVSSPCLTVLHHCLLLHPLHVPYSLLHWATPFHSLFQNSCFLPEESPIKKWERMTVYLFYFKFKI